MNIGGTDIVDGNPKLTLGLLWSIILHWQVRGCSEISSFPGIVCVDLLEFSQTFPGFWWWKITAAILGCYIKAGQHLVSDLCLLAASCDMSSCMCSVVLRLPV